MALFLPWQAPEIAGISSSSIRSQITKEITAKLPQKLSRFAGPDISPSPSDDQLVIEHTRTTEVRRVTEMFIELSRPYQQELENLGVDRDRAKSELKDLTTRVTSLSKLIKENETNFSSYALLCRNVQYSECKLTLTKQALADKTSENSALKERIDQLDRTTNKNNKVKNKEKKKTLEIERTALNLEIDKLTKKEIPTLETKLASLQLELTIVESAQQGPLKVEQLRIHQQDVQNQIDKLSERINEILSTCFNSIEPTLHLNINLVDKVIERLTPSGMKTEPLKV